MRLIRRVYRLHYLIIHLFWGAIQTVWLAVIRGLPAENPDYQRCKQRWLAKIIKIMGGQVSVQGQAASDSTLLVCNHVSWLDIALLGGYVQVDFLSKSEVRRWPVIGWLADRSGTLFIQRGGRDAARETSDLITLHLSQGRNVMIFPEGTTTDGQLVRPFHARLFAAAITVDASIQPVAIRYLDQHDQLSATVPYVNQQTLLANLWDIMAEPCVQIELHFLPTFQVNTQTRKTLAQYSEQQIRQTLFPLGERT